MNTLDLIDAAKLLKLHPSTLQAKAKSGLIPGAKPGKSWVFIDADLYDWLRGQYTTNRQDISKEDVCSLKEIKTGITNFRLVEKQYTDLLAPAIRKKPRK